VPLGPRLLRSEFQTAIRVLAGANAPRFANLSPRRMRGRGAPKRRILVAARARRRRCHVCETRRAPCETAPTPLGAPHGGRHAERANPPRRLRFPGTALRQRPQTEHAFSQLLAPAPSGGGRSPGAYRVRGCVVPRPRSPHPAPPSRRLRKTPLMSEDE
jgi:hypothetical protein